MIQNFITANITSYIGQCYEAEHYYCQIYKETKIDLDKNIQQLHNCRTSFNNEELYKVLTKEDAEKLSKKDGNFKWIEGAKVNRFNSLCEIKEELLKQFPDENIISYYECRPYQNMLIKIDGDFKPIEYLEQVWSYLPSSVYKDLIPKHFSVKCECGNEYSEKEFKENIMVDQHHFNRTITIFDVDMCECCDKPYLMWDVVL